MAVRGIFTSDANIEGTRKKDFASALLTINPQGTAPLLALSSGMKNARAKDTIVTWFEENYLSGRLLCSTNAGTTTTALVLNDVDSVVPGQIFMIESTNEYVYVTAVNLSTKTITVQRGFGGTTATAADGSTTAFGVQRIGSAHEEASDRPTAVANRGYPRFNAVQTFRNSWNVSGLSQELEYKTGPIAKKAMHDCTMEHAGDIERSLIWGRYTYGVQNNSNFYTMAGLKEQIKTNVVIAASGNTSYKLLRDFLETVFTRNVKGLPNERIAFCGNSVVNALDDITRADGNIQVYVGQTDFGLKVRKLITPYGDISLMTHPMMVESPKWTEDLIIIHPGVTELRWLRQQEWDNYNSSGTRSGKDADYGVVTSDLTLCYKAEVTGGYYSGIKAGVAS